MSPSSKTGWRVSSDWWHLLADKLPPAIPQFGPTESMMTRAYPTIGIRPTIDGRLGGVRESLEERTMRQAELLAELLSSELRYPDGTFVQCVVADSCIGGVAEAAACADKFRKEGVGVSLTVTPCWCYGSETMDMDPLTPKAVWGFNGTERPGAVYLAAVLAGHTQKGLPAFGIYESWSFFLGLSVVNSWDKKFEKYNGLGLNVAPLFAYAADWWEGSYVQIWPGYTYFIVGELKKEGSGNLDITTGGNITDTVMWALTYQKNFDVDLLSFRRGPDTGVTNDQNIFLNVTTYF